VTTSSQTQPLPRRSESGLHTRAVHAAAGVILAAMQRGTDDPTGLAIALDSARLLNSPEHAAELERLRARLADVHRMPQDSVTVAEIRLAQYGQRTTWSTATYDSGTERALHEIACGLRDALEETRDQRNAARLKVAELEARVTELEAQLARPVDEEPIPYALTTKAAAVRAEEAGQ